MRNKNNLLLLIILGLLAASAVILYRNAGSDNLSLSAGAAGGEDVLIRSQLDDVDRKIKSGIKSVQDGGALDVLTLSPQFLELATTTIAPPVVDQTGRPNPFLPVDYSPKK